VRGFLAVNQGAFEISERAANTEEGSGQVCLSSAFEEGDQRSCTSSTADTQIVLR
jgi:hypothetical protein